MRPASWSTDIFYYSDINLFLIDYGCCKLCDIWLLLFENNSRSYHYEGGHLALPPHIFSAQVKARSMLYHGSVGASSK